MDDWMNVLVLSYSFIEHSVLMMDTSEVDPGLSFIRNIRYKLTVGRTYIGIFQLTYKNFIFSYNLSSKNEPPINPRTLLHYFIKIAFN